MDKKIIDYKVVSNHTGAASLSTSVWGFIQQGWSPIGGVCVDDNHFYQAMVKYQEGTDNEK